MLYRPKNRFDAWWNGARSATSTSSILKIVLAIIFALAVAFFLYVIAQNMSFTHGSSVFKLDVSAMNAKQKQEVIEAAKKINSNLVDLAPPLSRETLGHATWSFLHEMAALLPADKLSTDQVLHLHKLLLAISELYPCGTCARHFRAFIAAHPIPQQQVTGRDIQIWLCQAHNGVNKRQGKPIVDCPNIAKRWPAQLLSDCGCSEEDAPHGSSSSGANVAVAGASNTNTNPEKRVTSTQTQSKSVTTEVEQTINKPMAQTQGAPVKAAASSSSLKQKQAKRKLNKKAGTSKK